MSFGSTLRKMREQHSVTQRDLAEKVGLDFTYISKIENEVQAPPDESYIIAMAEVFGVNKYDLIMLARKVPTDFKNVILWDEDVQRMLKEKTAEWHKKMKGKVEV